MSEKLGLMGIQTIVEPSTNDYRRSVVTATHHAREMLSLAQRQAEGNDPKTGPTLMQIDNAISSLKSAGTLLHETGAAESGHRMQTLLRRALHAAEAARGHVQRFSAYQQDSFTKLELDQLSKIRKVWRRAAEAAKKDTHRALVFICQRFPEAYEKEDLS